MIYVICIFHLGWYGTKGEWDISQCFMVFSRLCQKMGCLPPKKNTRKDNDELVTRWMEWGRPAWLDMVKKTSFKESIILVPKKIGKYSPNLKKIINYLSYLGGDYASCTVITNMCY